MSKLLFWEMDLIINNFHAFGFWVWIFPESKNIRSPQT